MTLPAWGDRASRMNTVLLVKKVIRPRRAPCGRLSAPRSSELKREPRGPVLLGEGVLILGSVGIVNRSRINVIDCIVHGATFVER